MNRRRINLWLDIVLVVLFVLTIVSLAAGEGAHEAARSSSGTGIEPHNIMGMLLVAGSIIHIALHWNWVKAVMLGRSKNLSGSVQTNRKLNLLLLICFGLCAVTGMASWAIPGVHELSGLHRLTGVATLVVTGVHFIRYWQRLTTMARQTVAP